jgi:hypothetical protein
MKQFLLYFLIFSSVYFTGCNSSNKNSDINSKLGDINISEEKSDKEQTVKKVFFNLPSPIELTQVILESESEYDPNLLNSIDNISNYESSSKLALNFGIYGADLCYCRVYDQLQESINYLAAIKKISDKLQIPEEEGEKTINRIEESIEKSDSIFQIIADTYASADGYLKENDRDLTATFILIGGWVEGMYFATEINKSEFSKNKLNYNIAEQKYSLENLMKLINDYSDNSVIAELMPLFKQLDNIYKDVKISYDVPVVVTDNETKVTTINSSSNIDINQKQLDEINNLIVKIRGIIIS